jgi:hypothetical protein
MIGVPGMWAMKWTLLFSHVISVAGATARTKVANLELPDFNLFATFRTRVTAYGSGGATHDVRFGMTAAEADVSTLGINFALLGSLNAGDFRSVVWTPAAVAPDVVGNPLSILPPVMTLSFTTAAAASLTVELYTACLAVA